MNKEIPFKWGRIAYSAFCSRLETALQIAAPSVPFEKLSLQVQNAWASAAEALMLAECREGSVQRRK